MAEARGIAGRKQAGKAKKSVRATSSLAKTAPSVRKPRKLSLNWVTPDRESLLADHPCCGSGDAACAGRRKAIWLIERFREGFVYRRLEGGSRVFLEYAHSEKAWLPVEASGWLALHCFSVPPRDRGKGLGRALVESVVDEAARQKKYGVLAVAAKKKISLVPEAKFFLKLGFEILDEAAPHFVLLGRRLRSGGPDPRFRERSRHPGWERGRGLAFVYTDRCPLAEPAAEELEKTAESLSIPFRSVRLTGLHEAKDFPCGSSVAALFLDGRYLTHEILTGAKLRNLLRKEGAI